MRVYINNTINKNLLNYINLKDIELIIVEVYTYVLPILSTKLKT